MRRLVVATAFFAALITMWQLMVMSGRWSPMGDKLGKQPGQRPSDKKASACSAYTPTGCPIGSLPATSE